MLTDSSYRFNIPARFNLEFDPPISRIYIGTDFFHKFFDCFRCWDPNAHSAINFCAHCAEVGQDEELVLQVLLLLQHENEFGARRVLWKMLPPAAARIVLGHLDELALGMVRAGLLLPQSPYALRPCPAEALAARQLGVSPVQDTADHFWLN